MKQSKVGGHKARMSYRLELPSGDAPMLNLYIKRIMRGQDLKAWQASPEKLSQFVRSAVANFMEQVSVVIVERSVQS